MANFRVPPTESNEPTEPGAASGPPAPRTAPVPAPEPAEAPVTRGATPVTPAQGSFMLKFVNFETPTEASVLRSTSMKLPQSIAALKAMELSKIRPLIKNMSPSVTLNTFCLEDGAAVEDDTTLSEYFWSEGKEIPSKKDRYLSIFFKSTKKPTTSDAISHDNLTKPGATSTEIRADELNPVALREIPPAYSLHEADYAPVTLAVGIKYVHEIHLVSVYFYGSVLTTDLHTQDAPWT
ncbi:hypothetical protein Q9L58_009358 [Maublancomyces gigas]|uniref:Ubiquitin-like domain-containing protein n=1 Tax=Discina gigas TaxID=1032678 RepID=A0ABR3G735_9PEZI